MGLKKRLSTISAILISTSMLITGCAGSGEGGQSSSEVTNVEVMQNLSARKALSLAINKDNFVDVVLNNGSKVANYFVPEKLALDADGNDYRDFAGDLGMNEDDEKAKEEWAKAKEELGFEDVELLLAVSDTDLNKKLAEYMQEELAILDGLSVKIQMLPFEQLMAVQGSGDYDISVGGWGPDYPDPLTYLLTMGNPEQGYGSETGYNSEKYQQLLQEGQNSVTTQESWEKYKEAEKLLLEDVYVHPLYQRGIAYAQKEYVSGITNLSFGPKYSFKWADVDKDEKILNLYDPSDITTLDTSKIQDALTREATLNVMEGLVRLDGDLGVVPAMAKTWEVSEDGKTWTFNLRDDATWSNGDKVTAHDFEYGFKRTLDPATGCQNSSVFYNIEGAKEYNTGESTDPDSVGIKALDDYTVEIKLTGPVTYFDKLMSHPIFSPQNQKFVEEKGEAFGTTIENSLFNGPFVLSEWKMEDQYNMAKNENYWDKDSVKLDAVNTKIVKEPSTALNLYEAGEIDKISLTADQFEKYKDSKELNTSLDCINTFVTYNVNNRN